MRGLKRIAFKMKSKTRNWIAKTISHLSWISSIFHLPLRSLKTGEDYHMIKIIVKRFLSKKKVAL